MKRIICHPDNLPLLRQYANPSDSIPVMTSLYMERTGRIIAPDGTASDREGWEFQRDDFVTWEETDLPWLLRLGVVTEEREALFYVMEDLPPLYRMPGLAPLPVMPLGCHLATATAY